MADSSEELTLPNLEGEAVEQWQTECHQQCVEAPIVHDNGFNCIVSDDVERFVSFLQQHKSIPDYAGFYLFAAEHLSLKILTLLIENYCDKFSLLVTDKQGRDAMMLAMSCPWESLCIDDRRDRQLNTVARLLVEDGFNLSPKILEYWHTLSIAVPTELADTDTIAVDKMNEMVLIHLTRDSEELLSEDFSAESPDVIDDVKTRALQELRRIGIEASLMHMPYSDDENGFLGRVFHKNRMERIFSISGASRLRDWSQQPGYYLSSVVPGRRQYGTIPFGQKVVYRYENRSWQTDIIEDGDSSQPLEVESQQETREFSHVEDILHLADASERSDLELAVIEQHQSAEELFSNEEASEQAQPISESIIGSLILSESKDFIADVELLRATQTAVDDARGHDAMMLQKAFLKRQVSMACDADRYHYAAHLILEYFNDVRKLDYLQNKQLALLAETMLHVHLPISAMLLIRQRHFIPSAAYFGHMYSLLRDGDEFTLASSVSHEEFSRYLLLLHVKENKGSEAEVNEPVAARLCARVLGLHDINPGIFKTLFALDENERFNVEDFALYFDLYTEQEDGRYIRNSEKEQSLGHGQRYLETELESLDVTVGDALWQCAVGSSANRTLELLLDVCRELVADWQHIDGDDYVVRVLEYHQRIKRAVRDDDTDSLSKLICLVGTYDKKIVPNDFYLDLFYDAASLRCNNILLYLIERFFDKIETSVAIKALKLAAVSKQNGFEVFDTLLSLGSLSNPQLLLQFFNFADSRKSNIKPNDRFGILKIISEHPAAQACYWHGLVCTLFTDGNGLFYDHRPASTISQPIPNTSLDVVFSKLPINGVIITLAAFNDDKEKETVFPQFIENCTTLWMFDRRANYWYGRDWLACMQRGSKRILRRNLGYHRQKQSVCESMQSAIILAGEGNQTETLQALVESETNIDSLSVANYFYAPLLAQQFKQTEQRAAVALGFDSAEAPEFVALEQNAKTQYDYKHGPIPTLLKVGAGVAAIAGAVTLGLLCGFHILSLTVTLAIGLGAAAFAASTYVAKNYVFTESNLQTVSQLDCTLRLVSCWNSTGTNNVVSPDPRPEARCEV